MVTGRVITMQWILLIDKCLLTDNVIIIKILKGSVAKNSFLCLTSFQSCEFLFFAELFLYIEWTSMGSKLFENAETFFMSLRRKK